MGLRPDRLIFSVSSYQYLAPTAHFRFVNALNCAVGAKHW